MIVSKYDKYDYTSKMDLLNEIYFLQTPLEEDPNHIPVKESARGYIVDLEDLVRLNESYEWLDIANAISMVSEASHIDMGKVILSVSEENIIKDYELGCLVEDLCAMSYNINLRPMNEKQWWNEYDSIAEEFPLSLQEGITKMLGLRDDDDIDDVVKKKKQYDGLLDMWNAFENKENFIKALYVQDSIQQHTKDGIAKLVRDELKEGLPLEIIRRDMGMQFYSGGNPEANQWLQREPRLNRMTNATTTMLATGDPEKAKEIMFGTGKFDNDITPEAAAKANNQMNRYTQLRYSLKDLGKSMDYKNIIDSEEKFNAAKADTLERLKIIGREGPNQNIEGVTDKDLQSRLETISKMVEKEKFPKSWLAKKIYWLRSLYRKIMYKWSIKKGTGFVGTITGTVKRILAFILRLIDKLAAKLQNAVNEAVYDGHDLPFSALNHGDMKDTNDNNTRFRGLMKDDIKQYTLGYVANPEYNNRVADYFEGTGRMQNFLLQQNSGVGEKLELGDISDKGTQYVNTYGLHDVNQALEKSKTATSTLGKIGSWAIEKYKKLLLMFLRGQVKTAEDLADHIRREKTPKGVLAKIIAKFRNLYYNIMLRFTSGIDQSYDVARAKSNLFDFDSIDANIAQAQEHKERYQGIMGYLRMAWKAGKHVFKSLMGKILLFIDKLLQRLQQMVD